jgi:aldehyde:ferredoxin oxidoreductase
MNGWTGQILRVNLTAKTFKKESFSEEFAAKWVGGRGFAVKILYDELKPGIDPTTSSSSPLAPSPASPPLTPGKRSSPASPR